MDIAFAWLVIGGLFEPLWVMCLERSSRTFGRMHHVYLALFVLFSLCSIYFLGLGMKGTNIGIAYAVWTAVGAVTTLAVSRLLFKELMNYLKVLAVMLILLGISGLGLTGGSS